jgi:hypothetical protein
VLRKGDASNLADTLGVDEEDVSRLALPAADQCA